MDEYYIAVGESAFNTYYVENTHPVIWSSDFSKCKKFTSYANAKMELEDNFITLASTIAYTGMNGIFIDKYNGTTGQLLERKSFI